MITGAGIVVGLCIATGVYLVGDLAWSLYTSPTEAYTYSMPLLSSTVEPSHDHGFDYGVGNDYRHHGDFGYGCPIRRMDRFIEVKGCGHGSGSGYGDGDSVGGGRG